MYVNYWVVLMPHYYHTIHWTINLIWVLIYVYRRFTSLDRMLHCYGLPAGIDFFCDHQQQNSGRNLPKSPSKELQRAPSVSRKRSSPFSNHMGLSLWWCPHYHLCLCTTFFKIIKKTLVFGWKNGHLQPPPAQRSHPRMYSNVVGFISLAPRRPRLFKRRMVPGIFFPMHMIYMIQPNSVIYKWKIDYKWSIYKV